EEHHRGGADGRHAGLAHLLPHHPALDLAGRLLRHRLRLDRRPAGLRVHCHPDPGRAGRQYALAVDPDRRGRFWELPRRLRRLDVGGDDGDHPHHDRHPAVAVAPMGAAVSGALSTRAARRWIDWAIIAVMVLLAIGMLIPFLWLFSMSFRPSGEAYKL